ncbi:unnamed protein product, partial [Ixodes pacificus]
ILAGTLPQLQRHSTNTKPQVSRTGPRVLRKVSTLDQQFVDLGCGTGDFIHQELLPRCQPCRRVVASDISQEMVRFAKRSFLHPQNEYDVYDFRDDASKIVGKYGRFDRAYSFFALHYAEDLVSALRNIADSMTDDGECLLVFAALIPGYAVWRKVVQMDRWKSYAEFFLAHICELFIPKNQDLEGKAACVSHTLATLESAKLRAIESGKSSPRFPAPLTWSTFW